MKPPAAPASRRRITTTSFFTYFLFYVTWSVLTPFLPLYLQARGFTPSRIGVLLGIFELAGVGGSLLVARAADRRSVHRELLAAGLLVAAAALLCMQLTTAFVACAAFIMVMGLGYRSTIPLMDAHVTRILPDPAHQYGRVRVAGSFGFIAASLTFQLTGLVTGDSAGAILAAFGVACVAAASIAVVLPPAPPAPAVAAPAGRTHFDAKFWAVIAVIFLGRFGIGAYYSFFSLYLRHAFPGAGVSMLWAVGVGAEITTIWFSGPLIRRWGVRLVLAVSLVAVSLRLGLFVIAPSILVIALAQVLHAFTFGTFHTASVAWINTAVPADRRGMGMALYNGICIGLSSVLASTVGGYVLEAHGFTVLFLSYAAVPLLGIAVLAVFGKRLFPAPAGAAGAGGAPVVRP